MTTLKPVKERQLQRAQEQRVRAKRAANVLTLSKTLKRQLQPGPHHNFQRANLTVGQLRGSLNQIAPSRKQHSFRNGVIIGAIGSLIVVYLFLNALGYHLVR